MQNKSAVLIFTVLLALATLYTLSFNYFSNQFENEAQVQGVYSMVCKRLLAVGWRTWGGGRGVLTANDIADSSRKSQTSSWPENEEFLEIQMTKLCKT